MKRSVDGEDRRQATLLPERVDDHVSGENPVRVIEAPIAALDLAEPGFGGVVPGRTGRPAYRPATPLKIYVHGYLNRTRSSRRLGREAGRSLEPMRLTGRLAPGFKTIADFRRDDGAAIRATCRRFVLLCRELDLLSQAAAAIDSSRSKAANARERNHASNVVRRRVEQVEVGVERHLAGLEAADRQEEATARARTDRLKDRLASPGRRMEHLRKMGAAVRAAPGGRVSPAGPGARAMAASGKDAGPVGHDVRAAVGTRHRLIVAHEATNAGHGRAQPAAMAGRARDAAGHEAPTAVADRGHLDGEGILACERAGITPLAPKPMASGAEADGRFGERDFVHLPGQDACRCPAGGTMAWRSNRMGETGKPPRHHWTTECRDRPTKAGCAPAELRRIPRREHGGVLGAMRRRLDRRPGAMRLRRRTAEHPSGTPKARVGAARFLTRTAERVSAEMNLHVSAHDMKRVIAILGVGPMLAAIPSR